MSFSAILHCTNIGMFQADLKDRYRGSLSQVSSFQCCLYVYVMFLICLNSNHVHIDKLTPLLSIFSLKCSEPKTVSKTQFTHYLVTNQVSGGGANLHIHRTAHTK